MKLELTRKERSKILQERFLENYLPYVQEIVKDHNLCFYENHLMLDFETDNILTAEYNGYYYDVNFSDDEIENNIKAIVERIFNKILIDAKFVSIYRVSEEGETTFESSFLSYENSYTECCFTEESNLEVVYILKSNHCDAKKMKSLLFTESFTGKEILQINFRQLGKI